MSEDQKPQNSTTADELPGYYEGMAAFWVGRGLDANPYSWREARRMNWHAGWHEARREAIANFKEDHNG